jgi:hypothetical protein
MEITPHVEAIRADLLAVTAGDEEGSAVAERLARALESSLQLRLLDAVGEVTAELNPQLPSGHMDVRLAGRDVQLVFVADEEMANPPSSDEEGGTARLTLRMPESLKTRVEQAAAAEHI